MARTGCVLLLISALGLSRAPVSMAADAPAPTVPDEVKKDAEGAKPAEAKAKAADAKKGAESLDALVDSLVKGNAAPAATEAAKPAAAEPAAAEAVKPAAEDSALKSEAEADVKKVIEGAAAGTGDKGTEAAPAPQAPVVEPEPAELTENEKVRRQELELMADELAVQAMKLWRQNDYKLAVDKYNDAKERLDAISRSQPRIIKKKETIDSMLHNLYSDWATSLAREAQQLVSVAKIEQAIEKCTQAGEFDPSRREQMDERIRRYLDIKKQLELKEKTKPELVDIDKEQREFDVKVLIEQGKVFLKNRRYADARDKFEKALLADPYEVSAIRYLRQINEELDAVGVEKYQQVVAERMAETRWRWAEPVNPVMSDTGPDARSQVIRKGEGETGVRAKLRNIIVPHIEYEDVPVKEVISELKQKSMELDVEDGTGVNILLQTTSQLPEVDMGPQTPVQGGGQGGGASSGTGLGGFNEGFGGGTSGGPGGAGMGATGGSGMGMGPGMGMGATGGSGMGMGPGMGMGATGGSGMGMGPGMAAGAGMPAGMEGFGTGFGETAGAGAAPAAAALAGVGDRPVTMTLDQVPLADVIDYICKLAGLKQRVEEYAVILADQSVPFENLETRFYNVAAGVFDARRTRRQADELDFQTGGGGGDDDNGDDDDNGRNGDDDDDDNQGDDNERDNRYMMNVDAFFYSLGVTFPVGARMSYFQRQGKLIVHNTPENHRRIQTILAEINETPNLVTIEAKFVEIQQTTLETLGFDWALTAGGVEYNPGTGNGDHFLFSDVTGNNTGLGEGTFQMGLQKDQTFSNGLRNASTFFGDFSGTDELFSTYTILGNYAFSTVIHALEQKANADVLSSPKVTTLSGTTAILSVVTLRYFPESWTEPEMNTQGGDSSSVSITPSIPEFGEETEIGVILECLPTVASDRYSIDLELKPQVIDFLGYDDSFNYTIVISGQSVEAKASMPILSERKVETKVIIWDGETVVLGGMIQERLDKYEDKVPLVGDIPVLGRLFRSNGEKSRKTNLLMFVTARLVDPSGRPLRPNEIRGMHDFRR